MPKYQVTRFQTMAPSRADRTTTCVTAPALMRSLPIVAATAVPVSAPAKFSKAARRMAVRRGSTPVLTTVATALAASWNPLM